MSDQIDKFDAAVTEISERVEEIKALVADLRWAVRVLINRVHKAERMVEELEK